MPPKSKVIPFTNRFVKDEDSDDDYVYTKSWDKYDNYSNDTPTKQKKLIDNSYVDNDADG